MRANKSKLGRGIFLGALMIPQLARSMKRAQSKRAYYRWRGEGMADSVTLYKMDDHREEGIYSSVVDNLGISMTLVKAEDPKGLVQIVHGAQEHKGYYMDFAEALSREGYTVLLSDNRGHGDSVSHDHPRAYISSIDDIVIDQFALAVYFKRRFPGLPLTMFGHSFGSLIARNFIMEHDDILEKLIMTGLVCYPPSAKFGLALGNVERFYTGDKRRGVLVTLLDSKTKAALNTISNNPEFLESFQGDDKLVTHYLNGGAMAIWESASRLKDKWRYVVKNPSLEVLAMNGTEDPLTGGPEGLADTSKTFHQLGYTHYTNRLYPHLKHDLLHEAATDYIMEDILDFLER